MIETIIKLDGTEEPYSAHKLNGWGEWMAKNLYDLDWGSVVMEVVSELPAKVPSQVLQQALIDRLLDMRTWSAYVAAGRLYSVLVRKKMYGLDGIPTVKALQARMRKDKVIVKMAYSTAEYNQIEKMINHDLDMDTPHFALHHLRQKYAIKNRVTNKEYETPQFTYMRMAMALAENEPAETRMEHLRNYYELLSQRQLSAPTPNYVNLGTVLKGFASCCLFASGDNGASISIGVHIADMMTQNAAGIGMNLLTRSVGDAVRNGLIVHQGKLPYIANLGKAVRSNLQNGRGGAISLYYNGFDPEVEVISQLRNPRSVAAKQNRDLHYALLTNTLFVYKAAQKENVFLWNIKTAPDLHEAFYGKDTKKFIELYTKYEKDDSFKKTYVSARKILLTALTEAYETGTAYWANATEMNRHTAFLEAILSSNLCVEITQPTAPYYSMQDLYSTEDHGRGEISTCSLAAIVVNNIHDTPTYKKASYYALKMIDYCINHSNYPFPHLALTAKARMNAGVGIMGLATHMAQAGLPYSSDAGKHEMHFVAERHAYCMIEASLLISQERGVAKWIHKTKWPKGWLPIDTYNRNVDNIVEGGFDYLFPWEKLRARVIENGGIGHSALIAYMPGEASSKALGGANSIYPVRRKVLTKTDNNITVHWAAPFSDDPAYKYEMAWDIKTKDMIDMYAIFQKFTDQSISADLFRRIVGKEKISSNEMLNDFFYMNTMGMKTRYYQNTETTANLSLEALESAFGNTDGAAAGCGSGGCTL
jgi:ribonucleoside-diphosphate reductase alpha chain